MSYSTELPRPLAVASLAVSVALFAAPTLAQDNTLADCDGLWFSTSEDFTSQGPRLPGGPVVSDGDLLSYVVGQGTRLCLRNEELLRPFDITRFDHGLDALDRIEIAEGAVFAAFSTEIDSVNGSGQFTAGDLLFTNGAVVPNVALLALFDLPRSLDLGLDAVAIEGTADEKRRLLARLAQTPRNQFVGNPGLLAEILDGTNTDILFSTEGTPPEVREPRFLDGDLLSAGTGTIVRSNADLLSSLPAGLPDRGVDYGLDAYTPALDPIELVPIEILSTEINARGGAISDGDALVPGPGIYLRNIDLIASLEPRDLDMGLDALAGSMREISSCGAYITALSDIYVADINPVSGLFDTDRPFGRDIRVQGVVPGEACPEYTTHEFQVRVSVDGGPFTAVLHPAGQGWMRDVAPGCNGNDLYTSDPSGWFTLTDYWRFGECPDDASLAVWRSTTAPGADFARLQIAMRPIGGGPETLSPSVRIRIDNDKPAPVTMALFQPGSPPVAFDDQCKIDGDGADVIIDILGEIADEHFSHYQLTWTGNGNIGGAVPVTVPRTYNSRPDLTDTGTQPPGTDVPLGTLNLSQEFMAVTGGMPLIECGYSIRLRAIDRAHNGAFNFGLNAFSHTSSNFTDYQQTFCLVP